MIMVRDPKTLCFNFDLPKDFDESLKCEIEFIKKSNEYLAEIITKKRDWTMIIKISMEKIFMNAENCKTS